MENNGNGNKGTALTMGKKPNILVRFYRKGVQLIAKVEEKPAGRVAVKIGKGLGLAGLGYGTYKLGFRNGKKSVVPVTIVSPEPEEPVDDLEDLEEEFDEEPAAEEPEEP